MPVHKEWRVAEAAVAVKVQSCTDGHGETSMTDRRMTGGEMRGDSYMRY